MRHRGRDKGTSTVIESCMKWRALPRSQTLLQSADRALLHPRRCGRVLLTSFLVASRYSFGFCDGQRSSYDERGVGRRSRQKISGFLDLLKEDLLGRTARGPNHTNLKCRTMWRTFDDLQRGRYRGGLLLSSLILIEGTRSVRPLLVERRLKDLFLWGPCSTSSSEEASLSS